MHLCLGFTTDINEIDLSCVVKGLVSSFVILSFCLGPFVCLFVKSKPTEVFILLVKNIFKREWLN